MAAQKIKVGVACPLPGERGAFNEWLKSAGYEPVPLVSLDTLARDMTARPIEALIADVKLVPSADLPRLVKTLGPNRPLALVGARKDAIEDVPRDATWIDRPATRDSFLLSIALALAEGRPARKSPRQVVRRLESTLDGVAAAVVDVSSEGVRLELAGQSSAALPPFFLLKVPAFGVAAKVKRVWVSQPGAGHLWCGGAIERSAEKSARMPWATFVKTAPTYTKQMIEVVD